MMTFPVLVAWSVALLVAHVMIQAHLSTRELGLAWHAGSRDKRMKPKGRLAGRAERASANFRETYPAFVGMALALALADPVSSWGYAGAIVWLVSRLVYIPLYLVGVAYIRSIIWSLSMVGLLLMFLALIF